MKSPVVQIQARYGYPENDNQHKAASLLGLAVGGPLMKGHTLVFEWIARKTYKIWWDEKEILEKGKGSYKSDDGTLTAFGGLIIGKKYRGSTEYNGFKFELPGRIEITVTQGAMACDGIIDMPSYPGQDGHCGTFNGNKKDDEWEELAKRGLMGPVSADANLFVYGAKRLSSKFLNSLFKSSGPPPKLADCDKNLKPRAEVACNDVRLDENARDACIFDVCAMGTEEAAKDDITAFEAAKGNIVNVIVDDTAREIKGSSSYGFLKTSAKFELTFDITPRLNTDGNILWITQTGQQRGHFSRVPSIDFVKGKSGPKLKVTMGNMQSWETSCDSTDELPRSKPTSVRLTLNDDGLALFFGTKQVCSMGAKMGYSDSRLYGSYANAQVWIAHGYLQGFKDLQAKIARVTYKALDTAGFQNAAAATNGESGGTTNDADNTATDDDKHVQLLTHGKYTLVGKSGWNRPAINLQPTDKSKGLVGHNFGSLQVIIDFEACTHVRDLDSKFKDPMTLEVSVDGKAWQPKGVIQGGLSTVNLKTRFMKMSWSSTRKSSKGGTVGIFGSLSDGCGKTYSLIAAGFQCNPMKWLGYKNLDPAYCVKKIKGRTDCNQNFFIHHPKTGGCGCVTDKRPTKKCGADKASGANVYAIEA